MWVSRHFEPNIGASSSRWGVGLLSNPRPLEPDSETEAIATSKTAATRSLEYLNNVGFMIIVSRLLQLLTQLLVHLQEVEIVPGFHKLPVSHLDDAHAREFNRRVGRFEA